MYRTCIFCESPLGGNEALEAFPVGRTVAFDAWKGRLWAVCPRCARWNLAPIEERWEATEEADRLFTDARLRVQSENVGLARLRDGTRLIRIGRALPGELAAWRYGSQLVDRRRRYLIGSVAVSVAGIAAITGLHVLMASAGGLAGLWTIGANVYRARQLKRVVHRLPAEESPTGAEVALRSWHVRLSTLAAADGGGIELHVPTVRDGAPPADRSGKLALTGRTLWGQRVEDTPGLVLPDPVARTVLGKGMVHVNHAGASRRHLEGAVALLAGAGTAEEFIRLTGRARLRVAPEGGAKELRLAREQALALEMALHEEAERRALEGELSALEAAWREAEEIASIADALPDDPLDRLRGPAV